MSREDLHELAWSKPMSELAKDFGISDVALANRGKRLGIPVAGRGPTVQGYRVIKTLSPSRPRTLVPLPSSPATKKPLRRESELTRHGLRGTVPRSNGRVTFRPPERVPNDQ